MAVPAPERTRAQEGSSWARSGAMALTGRAGGPPLRAPAAVEARLTALQASVGAPLGLDAAALLGERAACAGFTRQGAVSCGGATRLLPAADGWVAAALARPDDVEAVEAWLGVPAGGGDPWPVVTAAVAQRPALEVVELGQLLGLPVAALGHGPVRPGVVRRQLAVGGPVPVAGDGSARRAGPGSGRLGATVGAGPGPVDGGPEPLDGGVCSVEGAPGSVDGRSGPLDGVVVVDLSSLWAGPLCAHLLQLGGAEVVKVESVARPDGARSGPPAFFDLLHAGQWAVALDFRRREDIAVLVELLRAADVVIEGSRPRALEQLGVRVEDVAAAGRLAVWVSITAYGRAEGWRDRVGFGDDAAVAAGLVAWDGATPVFCADAVADPLTGLTAAAAIGDALAEGGQWLLDVSLHACAAAAVDRSTGAPAGPGRPWPPGTDAEAPAPRARPARGRAPALGADTAAVLARLVGAGA